MLGDGQIHDARTAEREVRAAVGGHVCGSGSDIEHGAGAVRLRAVDVERAAALDGERRAGREFEGTRVLVLNVTMLPAPMLSVPAPVSTPSKSVCSVVAVPPP